MCIRFALFQHFILIIFLAIMKDLGSLVDDRGWSLFEVKKSLLPLFGLNHFYLIFFSIGVRIVTVLIKGHLLFLWRVAIMTFVKAMTL